jgi:hypothetical protein
VHEAVEADEDEITLTDGLMVTNSCSTSMCDTCDTANSFKNVKKQVLKTIENVKQEQLK